MFGGQQRGGRTVEFHLPVSFVQGITDRRTAEGIPQYIRIHSANGRLDELIKVQGGVWRPRTGVEALDEDAAKERGGKLDTTSGVEAYQTSGGKLHGKSVG